MSVTTKHWSNTIETNALSFSSSTGMTLTSVISMMSAPSLVRPAARALAPPAAGPTSGDTDPGRASGRAWRGSRAPTSADWARRARRASSNSPKNDDPLPESDASRAPSRTRIPRMSPHLSGQVRGFFQGRPLEVVGQDREGSSLPSKSLDTKRKIVWLFSRGVKLCVQPAEHRRGRERAGRGSTTTTWARTCRQQRVDLVAAGRARGRCPPQEERARRRPGGGRAGAGRAGPRPSRQSRSRPMRTAAALLLPPPRPPATGIRLVMRDRRRPSGPPRTRCSSARRAHGEVRLVRRDARVIAADARSSAARGRSTMSSWRAIVWKSVRSSW